MSLGSSTNTKPASTVVCPFTNEGTAALEEVLIRVVVPVLKAGDQMSGNLALDGSGELVQMIVKKWLMGEAGCASHGEPS